MQNSPAARRGLCYDRSKLRSVRLPVFPLPRGAGRAHAGKRGYTVLNNIVLKGNILWSESPDVLQTSENSYLVCEDGLCAGVFRELPAKYAHFRLRDCGGKLIVPGMLARGELHCIGATTLDEYRQYIEKDPALERRFQTVLVQEPSVEDTIAILRGLEERYEVFHGVKITDSAIIAAATLSNRYITDRFLPDKAIDLVDEACAMRTFHYTVRILEHEVPAAEYLRTCVDVEKFQGFCKACENYGHNWSCPPYDEDVMAVWQGCSALRLYARMLVPDAPGQDAQAAIEAIYAEKQKLLDELRERERAVPGSRGLAAGRCMDAALEQAVVERHHQRVFLGALDPAEAVGRIEALAALLLLVVVGEGLAGAGDAAAGAGHDYIAG